MRSECSPKSLSMLGRPEGASRRHMGQSVLEPIRCSTPRPTLSPSEGPGSAAPAVAWVLGRCPRSGAVHAACLARHAWLRAPQTGEKDSCTGLNTASGTAADLPGRDLQSESNCANATNPPWGSVDEKSCRLDRQRSRLSTLPPGRVYASGGEWRHDPGM